MPMREDKREIEDERTAGKKDPIENSSEPVQSENSKEVRAESVSPPMKPYKPHVLYP